MWDCGCIVAPVCIVHGIFACIVHCTTTSHRYRVERSHVYYMYHGGGQCGLRAHDPYGRIDLFEVPRKCIQHCVHHILCITIVALAYVVAIIAHIMVVTSTCLAVSRVHDVWYLVKSSCGLVMYTHCGSQASCGRSKVSYRPRCIHFQRRVCVDVYTCVVRMLHCPECRNVCPTVVVLFRVCC